MFCTDWQSINVLVSPGSGRFAVEYEYELQDGTIRVHITKNVTYGKTKPVLRHVPSS